MKCHNNPTLLELAGVPDTKLDLTCSALILIDFQNEYKNGILNLGEVGANAIKGAKYLLEFARKSKIPVIHVVQHGKQGGAIFNPDSKMSAIVEELKPIDNETILIKTLPNSFDNTELDKILKHKGIKQLLVAGLMSHMCVSSTVRGALIYGYKTILCKDACATRNLILENKLYTADIIHNVTMAALNDRFATLMSTEALV